MTNYLPNWLSLKIGQTLKKLNEGQLLSMICIIVLNLYCLWFMGNGKGHVCSFIIEVSSRDWAARLLSSQCPAGLPHRRWIKIQPLFQIGNHGKVGQMQSWVMENFYCGFAENVKRGRRKTRWRFILWGWIQTRRSPPAAGNITRATSPPAGSYSSQIARAPWWFKIFGKSFYFLSLFSISVRVCACSSERVRRIFLHKVECTRLVRR